MEESMKEQQEGRGAKRFSRVARGIGLIAATFLIGASAGRTSAAFTAAAPIQGSLSSGVVALDAGGVQRLTFGGADLAAIGPGSSFTQTLTVTNTSTVTTPSPMTDIALWADFTGAPADSGGLGAVLQVTVTRSIGGGAASTLYTGSFSGLISYASFAAPIGATWGSRNGGSATGTSATSATYTFTFSLPANSSSGSGSSVGVSFVFEARNRTA